jgi:hypothetical protein
MIISVLSEDGSPFESLFEGADISAGFNGKRKKNKKVKKKCIEKKNCNAVFILQLIVVF